MKRSEMELEIRNILEDSLEDWELPTHAIEYTASNILIIIEAMGMLPPPNTNKPIPNFYEGKEHGYTFINEWENE